ncbi:MAG: hypothetical protein R6V54_07535, partial [Desulfobacteraceae bacterium]
SLFIKPPCVPFVLFEIKEEFGSVIVKLQYFIETATGKTPNRLPLHRTWLRVYDPIFVVPAGHGRYMKVISLQ